MQYILTALKSEAKPIIDFYGLEFSGKGNFLSYRNNYLTLVITGVGTKNVSKVSNIFFRKNDIIKNHIINIGISGGRKGYCTIGQLFLIDKVSDEKSKLRFNLLPKQSFGLPNNQITTVSRPVINNDFKDEGLVDMEAFEICKTINNLDGLDRLFILKIVSDHMDVKHHISSNQVQHLIKRKISVIDKFLKDLRKL